MNRVSKSSLNYLSKTYHLVGLQETRFESFENFKRMKHLWEETSRFNTSFWSQDHMIRYTGRAGVGLLLTPTCPVKDIQDVTLRHVSSPTLTDRYLLLRGTLDSTTTYIHVVYAPVKPNQRPSFFNLLPRNFDDDEDEAAFHIVLGDFNTVLDSRLDQANQTDRNRTQGQTELQDWMQAINVVDAWRLQHPALVEFSGPNARSRIDYVLMSPRLFRSAMQNILHDLRRRAELGDHNGIDFRLGSTTFRPATRPPWRCPEWVIQLPEAQKHLQRSVEELANRLHAPTDDRYNPGCLLDEHKRCDAIFLRELFQSRKNARQREIEELHLEINRLRHLEATNPSADQANQLCEKKAQLDVKLQQRKDYASQKKFASDLQDAEKGSKFFFRPPQILHNTPIPVDSPEELETMCDEFNEFWSGIYRSPSKEFTHPKPRWNRLQLAEILQHTTAHLTPAQAAYMDSPLTANDFYWAIKHTKAGKAPGPDGLPLAYYLTDLTLWCRILEIVYAAQLERGRMSKFQRRGQVCLLYKKGDRKEPGNYRPITLLNVDAKFGPKILAFRLGTLLDSLLGSDQYGFVPGRDIHHAHVRFQALMKLYEDEMDAMAGAVLLDFAKAFDSVVWDALDMILMHFGFGSVFRRWVRVMFAGTLVALMFNGSPLAPFELGRGVRQGDPLSPGLFVLFVEPLLNLIRAKMKDAGLRCGRSSTAHTVISFADDCTGLLRDLRDTQCLLDLVDQFCQASGMELNKNKTVVLPFRPWDNDTDSTRTLLQDLGLSVVDNDGSTKLLGIYYGPKLTDAARLEYLLANMQTRCSLWKYRARTLRGQVVILQQIILPVLWYSASVCYVPKSGFQDKLEAMIVRYMTKSMTSNIVPRIWWGLPQSMGGLGLAPVETMIQGLQLHTLCQLIVAVRKAPLEVPLWTTPVIELFNRAMRPWGRDFDILYAPVWNSPDHAVSRRSSRWSHMGKYWHQVMFLWSTKLMQKVTRNASVLDKLTMPFLDNALVKTAAKKPETLRAAGLITVQPLAQHGILRPTDLLALTSLPVLSTALAQAFQELCTPDTAPNNRAWGVFLTRIDSLLRPLRSLPAGPLPAPVYHCAQHTWIFDGYEVANLTVALIRRRLISFKPPPLPIQPLGLEKQPPADIWVRDLKMNKNVLPVYADLLYRLQHNALYVGYRLQHVVNAVTTCLHGCNVQETIPHLFWYCGFAAEVWREWLDAFQQWLASPIEWATIVYFDNIVPTQSAKDTYGYSLFVVFHIVRTVMLRSLWTHRNDIRFHDHEPNLIDVQAHVHALVDLHVASLWHATAVQALRHSSRLQVQLRALLRSLPVAAPFANEDTHGTGSQPEMGTQPTQ